MFDQRVENKHQDTLLAIAAPYSGNARQRPRGISGLVVQLVELAIPACHAAASRLPRAACGGCRDESRVDAKCEWEGCFAPSEGGLDFHIGETTKSFIEEIPDETIIIGAGGGGEFGTRPWGGESQLFQSREQPVSPRPGVGRLHATSRSSDLQETTGRSCMTSSGGVPAGHPRARHVRGGEGPRGQGPNEITKRSRSGEKTSNFYETLTRHTVINCCHNTLDYGSNPGRTRRADSDLCSFHTARRDLQNRATLAQDPQYSFTSGPLGHRTTFGEKSSGQCSGSNTRVDDVWY
ncbi:uncharacterized protein LOC131520204 [Neofelis nebulosa]|uniref:uncharacterized protein LOC131520204 n=1 Tax=Neofelis nebulosa TaxID=61452 RepID=UPI00272ACB31|nr:uncharacterized protein LOC131520204 [Neofelis nebulosa]